MRNGVVDGVGARVDLDGADELAVVLFDGEDLDAAAERGDDVEQGGAGGVHAERVEDEVGVGEEERGAEEECGGGDVSGDGGVDGVEALAAGDGEAGGLVEAVGEVRVKVAPKASSACSVWSRVRMDSVRLVVPSACRPAKRTAVLTWAEGMGVVKSMARSGVPWMVMGACPSIRSSFAPIWLRGLRMRSIGRRVREGSPMRVKVCGWEAMRPANMRMVEPELPQSRGAAG